MPLAVVLPLLGPVVLVFLVLVLGFGVLLLLLPLPVGDYRFITPLSDAVAPGLVLLRVAVLGLFVLLAAVALCSSSPTSWLSRRPLLCS